MGRTLTVVAVGLILLGVGALVGPTFGFSTIAGERGTTVETAESSNALLSIEETGETPDDQNDAVVVEITNNASQNFESLEVEATIDDEALEISDEFDADLNQGDTTGLELTCSGNGDGVATIQIDSDAYGSTLTIEGVSFSHTFAYSCGDGGVTADAGGPYSVYEGSTVQLDGTGSNTQTGNLDYSWQIIQGEGSLEDDNTARPTYTAPDEIDSGTDVIVALTVTNNQGESSTDTATITIRNDGELIADFTAERSGQSDNVDLDASSSSGEIMEYEWDIGNNGEIDSNEIDFKGTVEQGEEVKLTVSNDSESDSIVKVVN